MLEHKPSKHAYLILAHHQVDLLRLLLECIDDERNDVYIHFDAKLRQLPVVNCHRAGLHILKDRVNVRWGHVSMAEAEYKLLEAALASGVDYQYLHVLSGVDLPIKTQDYIHEFCTQHAGREFVGYYTKGHDSSPVDRKVRLRHFFSDSYKQSGAMGTLKRIIRAVAIRVQLLVGYRRNRHIDFRKGTQWISITSAFARYLVEHKEQILALYTDSFCCDEIFVQTALASSPFFPQVYDLEDEARGCMRHIGWRENQLLDFTMQDYEAIAQSPALFARKFSSQDTALLERIRALAIIDNKDR